MKFKNPFKKTYKHAKIILAALVFASNVPNLNANSQQSDLEKAYQFAEQYEQMHSDSKMSSLIRQKIIKRQMTPERALEIIHSAHSSVRVPFLETYQQLQQEQTKAKAVILNHNTSKYITSRNLEYAKVYKELLQTNEREAVRNFRLIHLNTQIIFANLIYCAKYFPHETHLIRGIEQELQKNLKLQEHLMMY